MRALLLLLTPVVVLAALVGGEREATLGDLRDGVEVGEVFWVQVAGDLSPGSTGTVWQDVRWGSGWRTYETAVQLQVGDTSTAAMSGEDGSPLPVVRQDVGALVRVWDPAVRVERVDHESGLVFSTEVFGVEVPGGAGLLALVQWLGAVVLLVRGPQPRWVRRWGWFWLFALPFGVTAFLVSSGPLPGRGYVAPGPGRLRGGRAFVVALLLVGALGGSGAL
ncbi:hypothetical protein [Kineococcus sp. SYSU DK001]|uniref:hypothetical protein n=1 Tax=Kineococcus sp. SYSU DK001 TaxID=3383122 RepID=UPI003D7D791F